MVEVKVNFDYDAEQHDELTIRVGDIIKNVSTPEGGWWEGELNGKKGLFPDNFVEVIKNPEKSKDRDKEKDGSDITAHRSSTKGHVAELANKLRDGVHIGSGPPKKRESLNKKKLKAKASFAYSPENDDELALEVGDVVEILKQEEEGWWEGNLNGKIGMFPSNFVELLDENGEEAEKSDEPKKDGDFQEIKGKKVQGIGFGNIFGRGPIQLKNKGASVKKVGPPETAERKKEEKSESPIMREKPDSKAKVRTNKRHGEENSRQTPGSSAQGHISSRPRQGRSPSHGERRNSSKIHVHVSHGPREFSKRKVRSESGLRPMRCSTPNRNEMFSDSIQLVKTSPSGGGNRQFSVSLDISSIEPQHEVKAHRPRLRRRTVGDVRQLVQFTSPEQPQAGRDVLFVSPPEEIGPTSVSLFTTSADSVSTSHLTDSLILHKKRLSSSRLPEILRKKSPKNRSPSDRSPHSSNSDKDGHETSVRRYKGSSWLNKSSSSLARLRSFVKNIFTSPQSDEQGEATESNQKSSKLPKKSRSLLPVGKKRRWTQPGALPKTASDNTAGSTKKVKKDREAVENAKEQDSSSNNSCAGPGSNSVYQTDEFLNEEVAPFQRRTSPQTYLASLKSSGKLPPYIQLIAKRYNLLDVLDGKRRVLHSSYGHLPFKEYYFDDSKNPILEQHDNSDEDAYMMDLACYSRGRTANRLNAESCEKGASADDIRLSPRELEDTAENAVASVLFSIIQTPEEDTETIHAPLASPEFTGEQVSRRDKHFPPGTFGNLGVKIPPFSEARRKFFETPETNLPQVDPFEKYRNPRHLPPHEKLEIGTSGEQVTPTQERYSSEFTFTSFADFDDIPLTPPTESFIKHFPTKDEDAVENLQPDLDRSFLEQNYSISLMSSFLADEESLMTPEKYPSFISIGYDLSDITAPHVSADPSLESMHFQPPCPPARPDYTWLMRDWTKASLYGTSSKMSEEPSGRNPDLKRQTDEKFSVPKFVDSQPGPEESLDSIRSLEQHHRDQKGKQTSFSKLVPLNAIRGTTDMFPEYKDKLSFSVPWQNSVASTPETSLNDALLQPNVSDALHQQPSLSESMTQGASVPEGMFEVEEGADVSSGLQDSYHLGNHHSDFDTNNTLPKGFRGPLRRPSSRILLPSFASLPGRIRRHSPYKAESLRRPLSWMYPEVSKSDSCSPRRHTRSLSTALKTEQSNRYLVIDSSSTLMSIHSIRDSLSSRQSVLDGDPKLVQGSSEKRKRHRMWKRLHQPKANNPVELTSYKKVYEPGTPMYDMVPLLNRSLTGGDLLDLSDNVNQNHPGWGLGEKHFPFADTNRQTEDDFTFDSQLEELASSTSTSLSLTPSVSKASDEDEVTPMESVGSDLTPLSLLSKAYGADDTLTSQGHTEYLYSTLIDDAPTGDPNLDAVVGKFVDSALQNAAKTVLSPQPPQQAGDREVFLSAAKAKNMDLVTRYRAESDVSFNALCRVAFGTDDDIQHDELRGFSTVDSAEKSDSRSAVLPEEANLSAVASTDSYLHVLDDLSTYTDNCISDSATGSPLFTSVPPSARSVFFTDNYDTNDHTIESLVADKSRRAVHYYSLTDIQFSPSSSSAET